MLAKRIFWMTMINRNDPKADPTLALMQLELDLLDALSKSATPTHVSQPSITHYITPVVSGIKTRS